MNGKLGSQEPDRLFQLATAVFVILLVATGGSLLGCIDIRASTLLPASATSLLAMLYAQQRNILERQLEKEYAPEIRIADMTWEAGGFLLNLDNIGNGGAKNFRCVIVPCKVADSREIDDGIPLLHEEVGTESGSTVQLGPWISGLTGEDASLPPFTDESEDEDEIMSTGTLYQRRQGGHLLPDEPITTFWNSNNNMNIAIQKVARGMSLTETLENLAEEGLDEEIGLFLYLTYEDELGEAYAEFLSCNPNINFSELPEFARDALSLGPQGSPQLIEEKFEEIIQPREGSPGVVHRIAEEGYS